MEASPHSISATSSVRGQAQTHSRSKSKDSTASDTSCRLKGLGISPENSGNGSSSRRSPFSILTSLGLASEESSISSAPSSNTTHTLLLNNNNCSNSRGSSPARAAKTAYIYTPEHLLSCSSSSPVTPFLASRKKGTSNEASAAGSKTTVNASGGSRSRKSPIGARRGGIGTTGGEGATPQNETPQQSRARLLSQHDDNMHSSSEDWDVGDLNAGAKEAMAHPSSGVSNGSGDPAELTFSRNVGDASFLSNDDSDGSTSQSQLMQQKTKEALEQLSSKMKKTSELIHDEQKMRDENVNEYLKLASNADKQQLARIKAVFEKKNQKSATNIQMLQKKLENYTKRQKEIEQHGFLPSHRQPKEVLRDMGQGLKNVGGNIREGFSGLSGKASLISKPKEIAYRIKNKFGSADNIKELGEEDEDKEKTHHGSATLPPGSGLLPPSSASSGCSAVQVSSLVTGTTAVQSTQCGAPLSIAVGSGGSAGGGSVGGGKIGSEEESECNSTGTSESEANLQLLSLASPKGHHPGLGIYGNENLIGISSLDALCQELQERREENMRLREEIDTIKQTLSAEINNLREYLAEERYRCDHLEEQINDLTELHQNEMENLKTTITDMEEKVQYQSEERIRDLHEVVENCQTRISRMEHQQAQQQQQFLTLEGLENSNARAMVVKLINILLTVLQLLLLLITTIAGILMPLLQTKTRLLVTTAFVSSSLFLYFQYPELKDAWGSSVERFTNSIS